MDNSARIKELRKLTGLSQADFAERYHIPRRTIENWERGVNQCPDYTINLLDFQIKSYKYFVKKKGVTIMANPIAILYDKKNELFEALDKARRILREDAFINESATFCVYICMDKTSGRIVAVHQDDIYNDEDDERYDILCSVDGSGESDIYDEFTDGWTTDDFKDWLKKHNLPTKIVTDAIAESRSELKDSDIFYYMPDGTRAQYNVETYALDYIKDNLYSFDDSVSISILEAMAEEAASTLPLPECDYEGIFEDIVKRIRKKYSEMAEEYSAYAKACITVANTSHLQYCSEDAAFQDKYSKTVLSDRRIISKYIEEEHMIEDNGVLYFDVEALKDIKVQLDRLQREKHNANSNAVSKEQEQSKDVSQMN